MIYLFKIQNPVDEIKKLAKFLERPLSEEQAQKIAEDTSFEKMKQEIAGLENKMLQMFLSINMRKGKVFCCVHKLHQQYDFRIGRMSSVNKNVIKHCRS